MSSWRQWQQLLLREGASVKSTLTHSRRAARGMTLVELLVAMTIGLFLIITVVSVYITTTTSSRYNVLAAQMNEDAALAIELLQENIRLAGYAGQSPAGVRNFSEIPLLGCDGGFTQASESGPFSALACNGGTQSDALAVRYEATSLNSQLAGAPPIPSNCSSNGIAPSLQSSGSTISLADNRFYIANDAANAGTPTLFCRGSDGAATFSATAALIPNVENLQIRYAITRVPTVGEVMPHQVTAYVDASHAALGKLRVRSQQLRKQTDGLGALGCRGQQRSLQRAEQWRQGGSRRAQCDDRHCPAQHPDPLDLFRRTRSGRRDARS